MRWLIPFFALPLFACSGKAPSDAASGPHDDTGDTVGTGADTAHTTDPRTEDPPLREGFYDGIIDELVENGCGRLADGLQRVPWSLAWLDDQTFEWIDWTVCTTDGVDVVCDDYRFDSKVDPETTLTFTVGYEGVIVDPETVQEVHSIRADCAGPACEDVGVSLEASFPCEVAFAARSVWEAQ